MALTGNSTSHFDVDAYYLDHALWPAVVYTVLLMATGTVGNVLVLMVYRRQYRRSVTRMFIFALAALDMGNCLITMPAELVILTRFTTFPSATWCKLSRYLTYIFNGSSSIILIAIAMDRYFKVCHPTHQGLDIGRARRVCLGSFLLTAFLSIPALIIYGDMVIPVMISGDDVRMLPIDFTPGNESAEYRNKGTPIVILQGTFCLLSTEYFHSVLPTLFYVGMMILYIILILFVVFFYSRVAKTMFTLTRKHSQMFTFYNIHRQSSGQDSAAPDDGSVSHHHVHSTTAVIRDPSTFDEDGPYEQCDQAEPTSIAGHFHVLERLSRQERQQSQRSNLDPNSVQHSNSKKFKEQRKASSKKQNKCSQSMKASSPPNVVNIADQSVNKNEQNTGIDDNYIVTDRSKVQSDIIHYQKDASKNNALGSKKFRKSYKIPKITIQDTSRSAEGLIHTESLRSVDARSLNVSSNSLLLRRIKSAENVNSMTKFNKLLITEARKNAPVFPDAHEDLLPKVSTRQKRKDNGACVGQVTKSCVNLDYVGGEDGQNNPVKSNSEKTLTLTKKTSPECRKKLCVIPLTGLSSKTVLLSQKKNMDVNDNKGEHEMKSPKGGNSTNSPENYDQKIDVGSKKKEVVSPDEASEVTLRQKSPDKAAIPERQNASSLSDKRKSQDGIRGSRSPRQEIVSTADILQEHHSRGALHPFRTSRMLFTITLVFVVSFLPFFIIALMRSSVGASFMTSLSDAQLAAVSIFIRSSLISNAVNPIVYGLLSSHFRRECTGLVCCLWRQ